MHLLYVLLVLLVLARLFGEGAKRIGQPMLVGELVAGILIGMVAARFSGTFPVLAGLADNEVFQAITDLGIFFLMLQAGIHLRPRELAESSRGALLVAVGGLVIPLGLGFGLGFHFLPPSDLHLAQSLFLGVALAITAVPVSVRVLMDLDRLGTRMGRMIVSAAIYDDVLSLVLLAVLTSVIRTGGFPDAAGLALLAGRVALLFGIVFVLGRYVLPRFAPLIRRAHLEESEFTFLIVLGLAVAVLAEALGMHFILGAFAAGLMFSRRTIDDEAYDRVRTQAAALSTGFLAPVFFASIGLHLDLGALAGAPVFALSLLAAATLGKVVGAGLPARACGLSNRHALAVGIAMNARGAVELILAGIALEAGLFDEPSPAPPVVANLFGAVILVAVVTTVATPVLLARVFRDEEEAAQE